MHQTHRRTSLSFRRRMQRASLSGLLFCFFLLSACSGATSQSSNNANTNNNSTTPLKPSIGFTLQNEGSVELQTFQQWIALMQQYHGDVTTYQQQYSSDQQALGSASSAGAYNRALQALQSHVAAIRIPAMKAESMFLFQELHSEVAKFGQQHTFHDSYNNTTYPLGYQYGPNGATGPY